VLGLVELHDVHRSPVLKTYKVPLNGIPSFRCNSCTTQLGVIHKLDEGALSPTVRVTNKVIEQYQSRYGPLRDTTYCRSSFGH